MVCQKDSFKTWMKVTTILMFLASGASTGYFAYHFFQESSVNWALVVVAAVSLLGTVTAIFGICGWARESRWALVIFYWVLFVVQVIEIAALAIMASLKWVEVTSACFKVRVQSSISDTLFGSRNETAAEVKDIFNNLDEYNDVGIYGLAGVVVLQLIAAYVSMRLREEVYIDQALEKQDFEEEGGCCSTGEDSELTIKRLTWINVFLLLTGGYLCALGVIMVYNNNDSAGRDSLSFSLDSNVDKVSFFFTLIGGLVFILSIFGLYGTRKQKKGLLQWYYWSLYIIIFIQVLQTVISWYLESCLDSPNKDPYQVVSASEENALTNFKNKFKHNSWAILNMAIGTSVCILVQFFAFVSTSTLRDQILVSDARKEGDFLEMQPNYYP